MGFSDAGDARGADARRFIVIRCHREQAVVIRLLVDAGDVVEERAIAARLAEEILIEILRGVAIARMMEAIPQDDDGRPHRRGEAGAANAEPTWRRQRCRERGAHTVGAGGTGAELRVGGELIGVG